MTLLIFGFVALLLDKFTANFDFGYAQTFRLKEERLQDSHESNHAIREPRWDSEFDLDNFIAESNFKPTLWVTTDMVLHDNTRELALPVANFNAHLTIEELQA